jgi:hypothetical protein
MANCSAPAPGALEAEEGGGGALGFLSPLFAELWLEFLELSWPMYLLDRY